MSTTPHTCTSCSVQDIIDRQLTGQGHEDCKNEPRVPALTKADVLVDELLSKLTNRPNFL